MEGIGTRRCLLALLRDAGVFRADPFVLIDVGCAGGIHPAWRDFGDNLIAHGIDPMISECQRLQAEEEWPGVKFHALTVGLPPDHELVRRRKQVGGRCISPTWQRGSSAYAETFCLPSDVVTNRTGREGLANESTLIGLTEFVEQAGLNSVDFLKVDVDSADCGTDLDILHSAAPLFSSRKVLGVGVEVNWTGTSADTDHTFHNTDRFLRQQGFSLFGVSVRPMSRRDLPSPFLLDQLGQTRFGQPQQGDAVYFRDLAAPEQRSLAEQHSLAKLAKLACLYEMFQVPDCAAELVNVFRERFAAVADPEALLNALTPPLRGRTFTYREYLATFEQDIKLFMAPHGGWLCDREPMEKRHQEEIAYWKGEFNRLKTDRDHLKMALTTLQASRSWRLAQCIQTMAGFLGLRRQAG